jgi:hypothetical protein
MTDIVEKLTDKDVLTSIISSVWCKPNRTPGEISDLMKIAVDEINRLREENENLRKALKPLASLAADLDPQEPNHLVGAFISSQAILAANKILQGDE